MNGVFKIRFNHCWYILCSFKWGNFKLWNLHNSFLFHGKSSIYIIHCLDFANSTKVHEVKLLSKCHFWVVIPNLLWGSSDHSTVIAPVSVKFSWVEFWEVCNMNYRICLLQIWNTQISIQSIGLYRLLQKTTLFIKSYILDAWPKYHIFQWNTLQSLIKAQDKRSPDFNKHTGWNKCRGWKNIKF